MSDFPTDIPALTVAAQHIADRPLAKFRFSSAPRTGALLRTLVASKPGGNILEVGAGVGVGASWLLAGMDADARLTCLEVHPRVAEVATEVLAPDPRATVVHTDATEWLAAYDGPPFDFAFVDTTITKFERRDALTAHLADGAVFVADDLLPQERWADDHPQRVERFRKEIMEEPHMVPTLLDWSSGLCVATYRRPR